MIEAKAFGICPGIEIAEALTKMLKQLKTEEQPAQFVLKKEFIISPLKSCPFEKCMLPIRLAITSGVRERLRTKTARDFCWKAYGR